MNDEALLEGYEDESGKSTVEKMLQQIEGLDDAQLLNIHSDYKYRSPSINRITVGELKKQLEGYDPKDPESRTYIQFPDGQGVDLDAGDEHASLEIATPEVQERDQQKEILIHDVNALTNLGVPPELFCEDDGRGYYEYVRSPAQILEYAKIIEKYLADKQSE